MQDVDHHCKTGSSMDLDECILLLGVGVHHCLRNILYIYALFLCILLLGVCYVLVHSMKPSHDFVDELLIYII